MDIEQSVEKILSRTEIIADLFYQIFLDRYPDVAKYFVKVDLSHQSVLLTVALITIERFYRHSYPAVGQYLTILGARHQRWGIPGELFPKFRECLLDTLARFHGTDWSASLETQWREAVDKATACMLAGYDEGYVC